MCLRSRSRALRMHREWMQAHSRSEEHTSELQSPCNLVCRLLLEKKKIRDSFCRPRAPACNTKLSRSPPQKLEWITLALLTSSAFFFNDTSPTEIYTLSLHDALPI